MIMKHLHRFKLSEYDETRNTGDDQTGAGEGRTKVAGKPAPARFAGQTVQLQGLERDAAQRGRARRRSGHAAVCLMLPMICNFYCFLLLFSRSKIWCVFGIEEKDIGNYIVCFLQLGQADRFPYNLVNVSWCIHYCLYTSNQRE